MAGSFFLIGPRSKLDYHIDWTAWLVTDVIVDSTWVLDPADGATVEDSTFTTVVASIKLLSMVATQVAATNHITTEEGREDERTLILYQLER